MTLRLVSAPPSFSLFSCRATASTALPPPTPTPTPAPTLISSIPQSPPLTCALHCPHFQSCSGCTHEFNLHRPVILDDATNFFRKHGVSDFTFDTCKLWGWRCRAKLAVRGSSTEPLIGLYEEGTHNVVDIPQCQAHHPNINAAVELLRRGIIEIGVEPYIEDEGTGDLRYVQMAVTTYNTSLPAAQRYKNGKVQVTLVWNSRNENSPGSDKLNALANFLWKNGGQRSRLHLIHSVWANFQTSTNNIIFGNKWRHLLGERDFWEHVGGIDVSLAPSSFGQANTRAFDALLRRLQKYVPYESDVADLYAGAGVIGLSLAATRKCRSIKCIEINKESKASFEKTIERLPATVDSSITWHHADASKEPFLWLLGSDVVVIDPPRKGLDASLIDALKNISSVERKAFSSSGSSNSSQEEKRPWVLRAKEDSVQIGSKPPTNIAQSVPQTLIYISCGWESFKEDCKSLLSSKAWYLEKAHGFNFFPGTQSIEVLAVFKRGPQKKKQGKKKKKHLQGAVRH
ncbi:hypothetical protein GLYMA_16G057700v4 [Glycine max]|uniref:Methyltransferase small domain-containing protein n=2 Tax=Glycine subgen. Soja TaxID=1462606 RepID=K7MFD5_SOYBN|nr:uncharacterized RNA methyltransferase pc1998 [Glycine max]XP_028208082.1 uncharacterized protein LOC114391228 [Glycine soja]KAH1150142.1 hypothetical protein GYH30_044269 [Glycine max]KRH06956.1 hypothetical protein GLYMA_16G057700v4 [Glycine max]RZB59768.1 putative RNA methyltransferase pc1998 [Glycine soja]|eukprot:XP_006599034.1 uncharacterized protein LOC100816889 [Glycine max]